MTVAIAVPWPWGAVGGVNEVVRNLLVYLVGRPALGDAVLVCPSGGAPVPISANMAVRTESLPCVALPFGRNPVYWVSYLLNFAGNAALWRHFIDDNRVTAIHIHPGDFGLVAVALAARSRSSCRPKVSVSFHGFDVDTIRDRNRLARKFFSYLLGQVDSVNACSKWLRDQLTSTGVTTGDRITVTHNGIDPQALDAECPPTSAPQHTSEKIILCLATYEHKKGIDVLIRAFDLVAAAIPEAKLVAAGRLGPQTSTLAAMAQSADARDRISLIGPVSHTTALALLRKSHVAVLPSRKEPFGIAILEAAWACVPIIATDVGGIPEILVNEFSGLLVPQEDYKALATAIIRVLKDPQLATDLARNANAHVIAQFDWLMQAPKYLGV